MLVVVAVALRAGGRRLALFALATLTYILLAGYWRASMNTLALVSLAVPLSVLLGFLLGVVGYRVSGKTGTAWKASGGGYSRNRYMSVFGGVVPASNPRLAAVIVIDEPSGATTAVMPRRSSPP
jgi:hypothetical protein